MQLQHAKRAIMYLFIGLRRQWVFWFKAGVARRPEQADVRLPGKRFFAFGGNSRGPSVLAATVAKV